jgi:Bax protein
MKRRNIWNAIAAILLTSCLMVMMSSRAVLAKEKEIVVEVSSTEQLGDYFDSVGYNVAANPDILKMIPRFRFTHIPKNWEEDTSVPLKKSVFFRAGASAILQVNESLVRDRQRLSKIKLTNMSQKERQWLNQMMSTYKVTEDKASFTDEQLRELMVRVDAIPPSLALVQSAIESGWGRSRFAKQGNAMFGQWTTSGGIKAKGSDARLAAFPDPRESLNAYCLNLNTHPSYAQFRTARAEMRKANRPLSGSKLAEHLGSYSEKGDEYVELVKGMIERDRLEIADSAQLAKGPIVVFRPVSKQ